MSIGELGRNAFARPTVIDLKYFSPLKISLSSQEDVLC